MNRTCRVIEDRAPAAYWNKVILHHNSRWTMRLYIDNHAMHTQTITSKSCLYDGGAMDANSLTLVFCCDWLHFQIDLLRIAGWSQLDAAKWVHFISRRSGQTMGDVLFSADTNSPEGRQRSCRCSTWPSSHCIVLFTLKFTRLVLSRSGWRWRLFFTSACTFL